MSRGTPAAAGIVCVVLCAVAPTSAEPPCLDWEIAGSGIDELVAAAIEVLESAGHDPMDYRVELRMESMDRPKLRSIDARRYRSVVFLPRHGGDSYAVRVHPKYPCELSWVWHPRQLTEWQRRVVRRAQAVMRASSSASASSTSLTEVEVLESARTVSVRLWGADAGKAELVVTLDKSSLDVVSTGNRGG